MILPCIEMLRRNLKEAQPSGVLTMKDELLQQLNAYFDPEEDPLLFTATLLDPRYKARYFKETTKTKTNDAIKQRSEFVPAAPAELCANPAPAAAHVPAPAKRARSIWDFAEVEDVTEAAPTAATTIAGELVTYLQEGLLPKDNDPLAWWRAHKDRLPSLSQAARRYLSAPATSVDSERTFSLCGEIADVRCSRLLTENFEKLVFLKYNIPKLHFKY
jgi:hypothetical protein